MPVNDQSPAYRIAWRRGMHTLITGVLLSAAVGANGAEDGLQVPGGPAIKRKLELPAQTLAPDNACAASVSLDYTQMYDRVRVDARVLNDDCVRSHGVYTIRIRSRNEQGEATTRDFEESWSRVADEPVQSRRIYEMGGDIDLIWVRVRVPTRDGCLCDDGEPTVSNDGATDDRAREPG